MPKGSRPDITTSDKDSFFREVDAILSGGSTLADSAERLYAALTVQERLSLLHGDQSLTGFFYDMLSGGFCAKPHPSGVIARLGVPGILFTDGPRGPILGTAFPTASTRACSFDPVLEELIVGVRVYSR